MECKMKHVMDAFWQEPANHFQTVLKGYEIELVKGTCTPNMYQDILFRVLSEWLSMKMDKDIIASAGNVNVDDEDYSSRVFDEIFDNICGDNVNGV